MHQSILVQKNQFSPAKWKATVNGTEWHSILHMLVVKLKVIFLRLAAVVQIDE